MNNHRCESSDVRTGRHRRCVGSSCSRRSPPRASTRLAWRSWRYSADQTVQVFSIARYVAHADPTDTAMAPRTVARAEDAILPIALCQWRGAARSTCWPTRIDHDERFRNGVEKARAYAREGTRFYGRHGILLSGHRGVITRALERVLREDDHKRDAVPRRLPRAVD